MGKGKMNEIDKFCFNLERNVPFGVESSCIRAMNPWLRRELRALVRKAYELGHRHGDYSEISQSANALVFEEVMGFKP